MSGLLDGLPKITGDGDIGVGLLGIAVGYFGDSLLAPHIPGLHIPPGEASMYVGAAFLGAKRSIQAWLNRDKPVDANLGRRATKELVLRAESLSDSMKSEEKWMNDREAFPDDFRTACKRLDVDLRLFHSGFITSTELESSVSKAVEQLRAYRLGS